MNLDWRSCQMGETSIRRIRVGNFFEWRPCLQVSKYVSQEIWGAIVPLFINFLNLAFLWLVRFYFWNQEPCQDLTYPLSLFLESRRTLNILDEPGDGVRLEGTSIRSFFESFIKIWHQERCQDLTCPLSLFLESRRTLTFLMNLEMVSDWREHP